MTNAQMVEVEKFAAIVARGSMSQDDAAFEVEKNKGVSQPVASIAITAWISKNTND